MAFTKIIRPFVAAITSPPRVRSNVASLPLGSGPDTVILRLGEGTKGSIVSWSWHEEVQLYMTKQQKEEPRT